MASNIYIYIYIICNLFSPFLPLTKKGYFSTKKKKKTFISKSTLLIKIKIKITATTTMIYKKIIKKKKKTLLKIRCKVISNPL